LRNIRLARRIERAGARAADAVSVVVPEHLPRVARLRGRDDAVVIDNTPVLADLGPTPVRAREPASGDPLTVLYTGEIHRYRGIDTVIEAARLLAADSQRGDPNSPPVRFILVGTGKLLDELRRSAARGGVGETVSFLGWQPDLRPFLADADIGIIPPHASEH